jgi:uncharacterized protein YcnI
MSVARSHRFARAGATAVTAATFILAGAAVAQAHVQVIPDQTAAGSERTKLTFRVPTESETASTVGLSVALPTDTPFAEVLAQPLPGWSITVKEGNLPKPVVVDGTTFTKAPILVTWTAAKGQGVPPNEFQEFSLAAGPIPTDAKEMSFPAIQTYSDGSVVKWNQPQPAGADEPEHPVPHFAVTAALPNDDDAAPATAATAAAGTAGSTGTEAAAVKPASSTAVTDASDATARGLGIGGLVVGVLGLGFGAIAWRRAGSRS